MAFYCRLVAFPKAQGHHGGESMFATGKNEESKESFFYSHLIFDIEQ